MKKEKKKWFQHDSFNSQAEKEKREKEEKEQIFSKELKREEQEKFESGRMSDSWLIAPSIIGGLGFFVYLALLFFFDLEFSLWIIGSLLVAMSPVYAGEVNTDWDKILRYKNKLADSNQKYSEKLNSFNYSPYSVYFDASWEKVLYVLAKIAGYLLSWVVIGVLGWLLLKWIGSINPTSIIIILLVIIIGILLNKNRY